MTEEACQTCSLETDPSANGWTRAGFKGVVVADDTPRDARRGLRRQTDYFTLKWRQRPEVRACAPSAACTARTRQDPGVANRTKRR